VYRKLCETCGLPIPDLTKKIDPFTIPCSILHVRCLRCGWPVAKNLIDEDEICDTCKRIK